MSANEHNQQHLNRLQVFVHVTAPQCVFVEICSVSLHQGVVLLCEMTAYAVVNAARKQKKEIQQKITVQFFYFLLNNRFIKWPNI